MIFSNPYGLLALLGIPIILLIHFLQDESRQIRISTLFLWDHLAQSSVRGRQFQQLRKSLPMWLQLLAVCLLSWILAQPRWVSPESVQSIVVVLDSSYSMLPYREKAIEVLEKETGSLEKSAQYTEWLLLESVNHRKRIYSGKDRSEMINALQDWHPQYPNHDSQTALLNALHFVQGKGLVLFVTDHKTEVPAGVQLLSIGTPFDNVGFGGLTIEEKEGKPYWKVLIRNYSDTDQNRTFWIETTNSESQKNAMEQFTLKEGSSQIREGFFPPGQKQLYLRLDADRFDLDDYFPVIRPSEKSLTISSDKMLPSIYKRLIDSAKETFEAQPGAKIDLVFLSKKKEEDLNFNFNAIVFLDGSSEAKEKNRFFAVSEVHPLMNDLNWQGLLLEDLPRGKGFVLTDDDIPLLWLKEKAVVFLREQNGFKHLVINFDVRNSNADRLPAFILMLHRFIEWCRSEKESYQGENVELNQRLASQPSWKGGEIVILPDQKWGNQEYVKKRIEITDREIEVIRAPDFPVFFQVKKKETNQTDQSTILYDGAAHFADTHEADFRKAFESGSLDWVQKELMKRNTYQDPYLAVWLFLLFLVLLGSWVAVEKGSLGGMKS